MSPRHGAKVAVVGGAAVDDGVVLFEQNSQHKDLVSPTHGSIKRARLVQLISMESTHAVVVPAVVVVVGPSVTVVVVARNSRHVAQQIASPVSVPHALVLARALQLTVFSTSTQTSVVPVVVDVEVSVVVGGSVVLFAQ